MQLERLSALELGTLVNNKEIKPTEVVDYFANRITQRNPSITAFTYTKFDEAKEDAKHLETLLATGNNCGEFAGVPVGLKDFLPSKKGWTNSHGGVEALVAVDDADSEFYRAANYMGAIAIGKTNAPAFGFSGACQNKMYGATKNPFDITRTSGGSSGGTAAAVADGLILLGEGGDAGGSIRVPSGWCNLFGFKASLGTIPSYCRPDGWAATHPYCFNGAITKTVADSAAILNHMARYNPRDPISLPINANKNFLELMQQPIAGMRFALTMDFGLFKVDPDIWDIVKRTAMKFEEAGAHVDLVDFNFKHNIDEILYCWAWSISLDSTLSIQEWKSHGLDLVKDHRDQLPDEFVKFYKISSSYNLSDMRKFNEIRTDILDNFEDVFETYDAILSPIAICNPLPNEWNGHAIEINGERLNPEIDFISFCETPLANFVGYPAASVPAGFSSSNLPVGLQIIGKQYHDEDVLAIAKTLEDIQPWRHNYSKAFNRAI